MIKPGQTISHFEIIEKLGAGGMGLVYLAQDTKLDRRVALKVLPPHALISEDDRARFYREARAAAALNHPNIAHVYEIDETEDADGVSHPFIAMEYVDGGTLADRTAEGPLPLKEAVRIAADVAAGLHVAHENNIVHRDVKGGNVMLTSGGIPKILDFGLAKTAASTKLTRMGSTLGTVAYMSPEQARGEEVDRRSDIWSLGAVLYEMITGRVPFPGDYEQAVVYAILNQDPEPITAVRSGVPMALEWIVSKCMAADPDDRYQSASEIAVDLRTTDLSGSGMTRVSSRSSVSAAVELPVGRADGTSVSSERRVSFPVMVAVVVGALAVGFLAAMFAFRADEPPAPVVRRLGVQLPGHAEISHPSLSSDGRFIAFSSAPVGSQGRLWLHDMTTGATNAITQSENSRLSEFSPDGRWLVFEREVGIAAVLVPDGTPAVLADSGFVPVWMSNTEVMFQYARRIYRKSLDGGPPEPIVSPRADRNESAVLFPCLLPGGRFLVVTVDYNEVGKPQDLALVDLNTGDRSILVEGAAAAAYAPSGHLVYAQGDIDGQVLARPIGAGTGRLLGPAVPVIGRTGFWTYGIGLDGSLAYTGAESGQESHKSLYWISEEGRVLDTLAFALEVYQGIQISPDGSKVLAGVDPVANFSDIYVYDLNTGMRDQINSQGTVAMWSADGRDVMMTAARDGYSMPIRQPLDRSRPEEAIDTSARFLAGMSRDGRYLVLGLSDDENDFRANSDLQLLDLESGGTTPVDTSSWNHFTASFSPDGRYIAYDIWQDDWLGVDWRLHVRDLQTGGLIRVSPNWGFLPQWSPDGKYIYYQDFRSIYRVPVEYETGFKMLGPSELVHRAEGFPFFALHPNGGRILVAAPPSSRRGTTSSTFDLVLNWSEELKRIAPPSSSD
ncbi:MAG: protein kinase [Rhodothermales bacterium]|nr:protein kinase [Rhodothermales bacterium]